MSEAEKLYREAAATLRSAEQYVELVGSRYEGGGGGIGRVHDVSVAVTVYHQERDGATNYHDSSEPFNDALGRAIKENFQMLANSALAEMRATKRSRAEEFYREMEAIAKEIEA